MTHRRANSKGFSLIELLVAIIIIGILATILIPVVSNRSAQARLARAHTDLESLSEAQQRVEIDTQYYVRMFMLNDTRSTVALAFTRPNPPVGFQDGLSQYTAAGGWHQNVPRLFIAPETADLVSSAVGTSVLNTLITTETVYDSTLPYRWNGPYINWQKDNNLIDSVEGPDALPDDPWGNNYLFFTRLGLLVEPDGVLATTTTFNPATGRFSTSGALDCLIFDRPTLLSVGPDGLPGDGNNPGTRFGEGDDIVRPFGR